MLLLCSPLLSESVKEIFHALGHETLCIPPCKSLAEPVRTHPDMLFSSIGDGALLTDGSYMNDNAELFSRLEKIAEIRASKRSLAREYPGDILFDAARNSDMLFGRLKHTAPELLELCSVKKDVKQGYARCSTLMLSDGAVSADKGLCKSFMECGLDVLNISCGGIELSGYGYGFIGGASAVLEPDKTVVFFGDITKHSDGKKITEFCEEHGYRALYPKGEPLYDHGSVQAVSAEL